MTIEEGRSRTLIAAEALMVADLAAVAGSISPLTRIERTCAEDGTVRTVAYTDSPRRRVCSTRLTPRAISYEGNEAVVDLDYVIEWDGPDDEPPDHFHIVEKLRFVGGRWVLLERISEVESPEIGRAIAAACA
jgi:hypothetical protein